jgi:hypothetical protein
MTQDEILKAMQAAGKSCNGCSSCEDDEPQGWDDVVSESLRDGMELETPHEMITLLSTTLMRLAKEYDLPQVSRAAFEIWLANEKG